MSYMLELTYQGTLLRSFPVADEAEGERKAREQLWGQPVGATVTVTCYERSGPPEVVGRWRVGDDLKVARVALKSSTTWYAADA
jgi:hypothetical protein